MSNRDLNEALEVKDENESYRETFYLLKNEIFRIRREYFLGTKVLSEGALEEVDEELEQLGITIENVLY
jgi:hypothetical protein